jgi:hypothetical protein
MNRRAPIGGRWETRLASAKSALEGHVSHREAGVEIEIQDQISFASALLDVLLGSEAVQRKLAEFKESLDRGCSPDLIFDLDHVMAAIRIVETAITETQGATALPGFGWLRNGRDDGVESSGARLSFSPPSTGGGPASHHPAPCYTRPRTV